MTLARALAARIRASGPITLADYMHECLLHPQFGYYTTATPFGASGDFITAPEISQMFGELLGLCLAQGWLDQGRPAPFTLAELGPGRGTLMADALRATAGVPGFHDAAQVVLVEASSALRREQAERVAGASWVGGVEDLPDQPLFLVANEFFDALPIRQFQRGAGGGWSERLVGLDGESLVPGLGAEAPQAALAERLGDTRPGDIVETCPAAAPVVAAIAKRIAGHGGAALIVDYGGWRSRGDTLQAVRQHAFADPFDAPGQADLTAHVDFETIARAAGAAGLAASAMTPQGVFLERLGITARAQNLAAGAAPDTSRAIAGAHRRLTHPEEMGNLFKVIGLHPRAAPPLPGLDP